MNDNFCTQLEKIRIPRVYEKNQFVFQQDDKVEGFYYLKSGLIQGLFILPDGQECCIMTNWPGTFFGLKDFFEDSPRKTSSLVAKKSEIIVIDRVAFNIYQQSVPEFTDALLRTMAADISILIEKVYTNTLLDGRVKVAYFIQRVMEQQQYKEVCGQILIPYTQDFIASTLNLSRWTVNNALHEFRQNNWLDISYAKIIIRDYDAIKYFVNRHTGEEGEDIHNHSIINRTRHNIF